MSKKEIKDWRVLEFYTPIEENFSEGNDFMIRGVAINETTTLNNVKYIAEELEKAASTFRNVPILLDHKNEIKNIVGRTTEKVNWNSNFRRIDFEAKIMDKDIKEMIQDGRISSVSIGAKVKDLTEEEDGSMKAMGIMGLEISLVAVPGDSHANLAQAIQQGLTLKEMAVNKDDYKFKKEDKMTEEEQKTEVVPEEKEVVTEPKESTEKAEEKEVVAEEKVQKIDVKVDTTEFAGMKAQIAELKELLMKKKELKEQVEEEKEEAKEEPKDETKGEVSTETEEKLNNVNALIVESVGRDKFSMYRDYSHEDTTTNLKRLVR